MGTNRENLVFRWGKRLGLALCASALVQVALIAMSVATGSTTPKPFTSSTRFVLGDGDILWRTYIAHRWLTTEISAEGTTWYSVELDIAHHGFLLIERDDLLDASTPWDLPGPRIPAWHGFRESPTTPMFPVQEVGVGWPWRCARSIKQVTNLTPTPLVLTQRGVEIPGDRLIPTIPIWHGALLNLLVLAAPCLAGLLLAGHARRSWRWRHARCAGCNYDLADAPTDAPCPECGSAPRRRTLPHANLRV